MVQTRKIIEVTVTDERGDKHTLRCEDGIELYAPDTGNLLAYTKDGAHPRRALTVAGGRWISFTTVETK